MKYYSLNFAQAYGTGQYGDGMYSCSTQDQQNGACTTAAPGGSTGSNGSGGGALTNTGIAVMAIVTIACFIIFVSLLVRIWRRKPVMRPQEVESETLETIDARSGAHQ